MLGFPSHSVGHFPLNHESLEERVFFSLKLTKIAPDCPWGPLVPYEFPFGARPGSPVGVNS